MARGPRVPTGYVGPNGEVRALGEAVIELAEDGRIQRVLPFWEPLLPTSRLLATRACWATSLQFQCG